MRSKSNKELPGQPGNSPYLPSAPSPPTTLPGHAPSVTTRTFGYFGKQVSSWATTSQTQPLAFGTRTSCATLFGSSSDTSSTSRPVRAAMTTADQEQVLFKALVRALKGTKAVFGRKDVAADDFVQDLITNHGVKREDLAKALEEMRRSPVLAALTRSLFAKSLATFEDGDNEEVAPTTSGAQPEEGYMDIFKETWERKKPVPEEYKYTPVRSFIKAAPLIRRTKPATPPPMSKSSTAPEDKKNIFPFMELPPELRLDIYREHLVDKNGYIVLIGTPLSTLHKNEVQSDIDTTILQVSKQINHEAKEILFKENTIIVMADVKISNHPIIPKYLMPDHVLSQVVSMTIVCEMCTTASNHEPAKQVKFEKQMVWRQLQDLTSLKSLRLIVVERENQKDETQQREEMLSSVIQRIPANCKLAYGSKENAEVAFVELVIMETDEPERKKYYSYADSYEVDADTVQKNAEAAMGKVVKGGKSGDPQDYRFPKRTITLAPLGGGSIDPRFVLGGGGK